MAGKRTARHGVIRRFAFMSSTALIVASSPVTAQDRSFTVHNASDVPLESIYVSPIYRKFWGGNVLNSTLAPGQTREIDIDGSGPDCFFDLRFDDANGRETKLWAEDLCSSTRVEFR